MKAILQRKLLGSIPKFITRGETSLRVDDVYQKTSRLSCTEDAKNGPISVRDLHIQWEPKSKDVFERRLSTGKGTFLNYWVVILPTFLHKSSLEEERNYAIQIW